MRFFKFTRFSNSRDFQNHAIFPKMTSLEKITGFFKITRFSPKMTSLEKNPLFQNHAIFPKMTSLEKNPLFQNHAIFPKMTSLEKTRFVSKTRTFHKYLFEMTSCVLLFKKSITHSLIFKKHIFSFFKNYNNLNSSHRLCQ